MCTVRSGPGASPSRRGGKGRLLLSAGGTLAVAAALLAGGRGEAWAQSAEAEPRVSLECQGDTAGRVLQRLGEAAGYRILVSGDLPEAPVSLSLADAPLSEAVRRVLPSHSFYLVSDASSRTARLRVVEPCGSVGSIELIRFSDADPAIRSSVLREALSSPGGGDAGEAAAVSDSASIVYAGCPPQGSAAHPERIEVVPPAPDGTTGPTLEQLEAGTGDARAVDPSAIELVPPGHE